jgi:SNF2 family DNA or RNA helicase
MLKLEAIKKNAAIGGIEPGHVVRIVTTEPVGDRCPHRLLQDRRRQLLERMLFRTDEANLSLAEAGRPWAFDAPGEEFKLAAEAYRINLAHLFDPMMAVHTSNVEPLPHQITAVYESMLPRQPLRYVLADDPGAGKTIMAGLLIRELLMRADAKRVLIVAPGSLVEQWQDEMFEKFGLTFTLFSREQVEQSRSGNPFDDIDLMVARVDQLSRNEDLQEKLKLSHWDLVVVDEAHKLSASYFGNKINKTKRFLLGELLGSITRHFLLMTATPHNGKEEDFQLFMSLLDADRFYGKFRDGAHKVDVTDLMRRMVKEDLLKFDGTPLFPERRAYTANYKLSDLEAALYAAVTSYVKEEMNRADQLAGRRRKGTVGFALTSLQRRLASSPEAIYQSLKRRRIKLKRRVEEEKLRSRGQSLAETIGFNGRPRTFGNRPTRCLPTTTRTSKKPSSTRPRPRRPSRSSKPKSSSSKTWKSRPARWFTPARTASGTSCPSLLQNTPEMHDSEGRQRKLIIFTEHRDTLNYLAVKIRGLIGSEEAVVMIHGGVKREDRRKVQELFRNDPAARVLSPPTRPAKA